ncbi:hypothetical protein JVU11DRAFT_7140 [Chiua virens]|nr:hypothetical protein JVU11DRAFT_7140 [Chiua virens]
MQSAYEMMESLLDDPTHYTDHFTTFAGAVVMMVTYGYDMKEGETFVTSMQHAVHILLHVCTPEISALCSAFPFVLALPAWFPGMGFLSKAAESRSLVTDVLHSPYEWTKRRLRETQYHPWSLMRLHDITSMTTAKNPELVQAIKDSAGTLSSGSVETTVK